LELHLPADKEARLRQFATRTGKDAEQVVEEAVDRMLEYDVRSRPAADITALDWSQCPAVESVPGKVGGAWVFKGTRMPVSAVFENLEDGITIDELVQLYDGLTREQIKAVLEFAARSLEVPLSH
jgi:uncharacterized protein (DUF433 family)